jgi:hypothetical protein
MFRAAEQPGTDGYAFLFWSLFVQAILVPVVSFVFILPVGSLLEGFNGYSSENHQPLAQFGMPPLSFLGGFIMGRFVCRALPSFGRMGRWAWILSMILFVSCFLWDLRGGVFTSFVSMLDVEGKDNIAVWLISMPTLFSAGYSIACLRIGQAR